MKKLALLILTLLISLMFSTITVYAFDVKTLPTNIQASQSNIALNIDHIKKIQDDIICLHIQVINNGSSTVKSEATDFMLNSQTPSDIHLLDNFYNEQNNKVKATDFIPFVGLLARTNDSNDANQINAIEADIYKGGVIFPGMKKEGYLFFKKTDMKDFKMFVMADKEPIAISISEIQTQEATPVVQPKKEYGLKNASNSTAPISTTATSSESVQ